MKLAVLASGNGTNLQALIDAQTRGALAPGEIAVVVSNKPDAFALERARKAEIPTAVIEHKGIARDVFEGQILAVLEQHAVEAIVLAGFMRILTGEFTAKFPLRILNTHPSLLPAFPGVDAPSQAVAHGAKVSGVTVHFVDATLDGGPIIAQVAVPVLPDDDGPSLHKRILVEEHALLPVVVQRLAAGRLSCQGRVVRAE